MYLTGFADEAAENLADQIKATKELGWNAIESRNINGKNIHDISEEDFEKTVELLDREGVYINCFGSAIANWAKNIKDDFSITLEEGLFTSAVNLTTSGNLRSKNACFNTALAASVAKP